MELRSCGDSDVLCKERAKLEASNAEIDRLFMSLYEDKSKGILTEQRFVSMTVQLENEQAQNKARIREILGEISSADRQSKDIRLFMEQIKQYATI
ncbi:MAG: hypothetical protein EOM64_05685 [Erysipelotrichia bacterium]|nr:hypothetical protein [Erysipelotrichia bacterium]